MSHRRVMLSTMDSAHDPNRSEGLRRALLDLETSFNQDLELESIEFVALAEKLQQAYGASIDFSGWISGMDLDAIIGLRVGQVVEFIVRCP